MCAKGTRRTRSPGNKKRGCARSTFTRVRRRFVRTTRNRCLSSRLRKLQRCGVSRGILAAKGTTSIPGHPGSSGSEKTATPGCPSHAESDRMRTILTIISIDRLSRFLITMQPSFESYSRPDSLQTRPSRPTSTATRPEARPHGGTASADRRMETITPR